MFREFKQLGGQSIPWVGNGVTSGSDFLKAIGYATAHADLTSVFGTSVSGAASSAVPEPVQQAQSEPEVRPARWRTRTTPTTRSSRSRSPTTYAKTTNGATVARDMVKVTNPPGTACYTYASCLSLLKAGKKINYQGASGNLDYNKYNNTLRARTAPSRPRTAGVRTAGLP